MRKIINYDKLGVTKEELRGYLDKYSLLDDKVGECQDAIQRNAYDLYLEGDERIVMSILSTLKLKHKYMGEMDAIEKEFKEKTGKDLSDFF